MNNVNIVIWCLTIYFELTTRMSGDATYVFFSAMFANEEEKKAFHFLKDKEHY